MVDLCHERLLVHKKNVASTKDTAKMDNKSERPQGSTHMTVDPRDRSEWLWLLRSGEGKWVMVGQESKV